jgi:hypothetical protein
VLLLLAILGMTVYGNVRLMPSLRRSEARAHVILYTRSAQPASTLTGPRTPAPLSDADRRFLKVFRVQLLFIYGYWTVLGLLVIAVLIVAWLDLREVLRNYSQRRRELWAEAIEQTRHRPTGGSGPTES